VIGYAVTKGWRDEGLNPARWPKHLENVLPAKGDIRDIKHFAAIPYQEIPSFYAKLKTREGLAARCLELAILTAVRTNDLLTMRRDHVDLTARVWTIPKTKTGVEHRVPLSDAAADLLSRIFADYPDDGSGFVFVGDKPGEPMSNGAMLRCRDRMIDDELISKGAMTPHGMRAAFKSWAGDCTSFERGVIEACLSHTISDKIEAAYRRSDFLDKRRKLMQAWAEFCAGKTAEIVTLHA